MIYNSRISSILKNIRFWIFAFFLLRLIGITNPPLEIGHNWRQSLTNMIARNLYEGNGSLFFPTIDMAGNQSGIIGSEFPFFNYLISLGFHLFGFNHWIGRLINLIISSFGIYFFYLLIKNISDKKTAFSSTMVLLASIWFAFSRKIMPDTFSVSLVIIGMYFCFEYLKNDKTLHLILFFIFSTLGILCKIPSLALLAPVLLIPFMKEIPKGRKLVVLISAGTAVFITCCWYFYWVPYLVNTYHYQLYFPKGIRQGFREIVPVADQFFQKFYFSAFNSYVAFAAFLTGIFFLVKQKNTYLLVSIFLIFIFFFIFILKSGIVFPTHTYYIIPFVPVMAFIAGTAISALPSKYYFVVLIFISAESIANQQNDFFIKEKEKYKLALENICMKNIPEKELIVINGGNSPQEIYFAHRKGWTIENESLNKLNEYQGLGASYLIIDKKRNAEISNEFPLIYSDLNFDIYRLRSAAQEK